MEDNIPLNRNDEIDNILSIAFPDFTYQSYISYNNLYEPYKDRINYYKIIKKDNNEYKLNIIEYNGFENRKGFIYSLIMPDGEIISSYNKSGCIRLLFEKLK